MDDSVEVSAGAHEFLEKLFSLIGENQWEHDIDQIFSRFVLQVHIRQKMLV